MTIACYGKKRRHFDFRVDNEAEGAVKCNETVLYTWIWAHFLYTSWDWAHIFQYQSPPSPPLQLHKQISINRVGFPSLHDQTTETSRESQEEELLHFNSSMKSSCEQIFNVDHALLKVNIIVHRGKLEALQHYTHMLEDKYFKHRDNKRLVVASVLWQQKQ